MNGLKVFTNEDFGDVAVISIDNKPYFEGIKVARILGYKNPNDAIKRHCKYPGIVFHDTRVQTGRRRDGTESFQIVQRAFISEGNLYRLIVKSKKEEAEKFESWVMDEVLPSIRNDGGYVKDETFLVKVLDSYLKQKSYCEKLINSLGLDIGRNRLFQWFRENGYIMKQNGENQPKQVYIDMGLFKTRQMAITTSEGIAIKVTTYVTGKGQLYFIKKLKGDFLDEEVCGYF